MRPLKQKVLQKIELVINIRDKEKNFLIYGRLSEKILNHFFKQVKMKYITTEIGSSLSTKYLIILFISIPL
jgi:hypothetical protein